VTKKNLFKNPLENCLGQLGKKIIFENSGGIELNGNFQLTFDPQSGWLPSTFFLTTSLKKAGSVVYVEIPKSLFRKSHINLKMLLHLDAIIPFGVSQTTLKCGQINSKSSPSKSSCIGAFMTVDIYWQPHKGLSCLH
jgi:hypothetical protein